MNRSFSYMDCSSKGKMDGERNGKCSAEALKAKLNFSCQFGKHFLHVKSADNSLNIWTSALSNSSFIAGVL